VEKTVKMVETDRETMAHEKVFVCHGIEAWGNYIGRPFSGYRGKV